MEDSQFALGIERRLWGNQFENIDAIERPTVATGNEIELAFRFGQSDIEHALAISCSLENRLKGNGDFPVPGLPS